MRDLVFVNVEITPNGWTGLLIASRTVQCKDLVLIFAGQTPGVESCKQEEIKNNSPVRYKTVWVYLIKGMFLGTLCGPNYLAMVHPFPVWFSCYMYSK